METAIDPFNIQYDFGIDGATEEAARFAEVWDGPVIIATLMRRDGDDWLVDHVDTDYVEPDHMADTYNTVAEFVTFIHEELNA